jgi:hypothetical protein
MSHGPRDLPEVIQRLHKAEPNWVEAVPVRELFEGEVVWEGIVHVYELDGHPEATRCYAWSHETDEGKERFVAVLHVPPVDSPQAAVRAAIVQEHGENPHFTGKD